MGIGLAWPGPGLGWLGLGFGTPENMVLCRNGPPNPNSGESRDPNELYGMLQVFGRARFSSNPTKPHFLGNFPTLGGFGQGPWAFPIGPLWAYRPIQRLSNTEGACTCGEDLPTYPLP